MAERVYVIAEAGVNHNGSLDMAKKLIDVAAESGADAVKFQTFRAEQLVSKTAVKADYQTLTTDAAETQYQMIKKLELDKQSHEVLFDYCQTRKIQFLSTPFDRESLQLLADQLDLPYIKIPSGEITNAPFLLEIAQKGKPVILSTGMSNLSEIETALSVLAFGYLGKTGRLNLSMLQTAYSSIEGQQILKDKVKILHCTTEYPAPFSEVNLQAMDTMRAAFQLPIGLSDHTQGIAVAIAAVARGATLIEKHFTLDRSLPGPDHKASLQPDELKEMIQSIRQVEAALGTPLKCATPAEDKNKAVARKSLTAAKKIKKGDIFTEDNLTAKRPGSGISPLHYWEWLGRKADRDYEADERIGV